MKRADITIVIPVRNEIAYIYECLASIFSQEFSRSKEVIVIDSGSNDGTLEVVKGFKNVRLIEIDPGEFRHGKTRNLGMELSTAPIVVYLNGDAIPADKTWLSLLYDSLKEDKQLAGVYGRHLPRPGCHLYMKRDLLSSMPTRAHKKDKIRILDYMLFSTVNCAIRRDVLAEFPFCDDILIAEDQCWGDGMIKRGYKLGFEPRAAVIHSHNYSLKETFRIKKMVGLSYHRFPNRVAAVLLGFPMILGGIVFKIFGDMLFIYKQPVSFSRKMKEIPISIGHRIAGFTGKYAGWIGTNHWL